MLILIADNPTPIIARIEYMIAEGNDEAIIYAADSYETALDVLDKNCPSVVLLGLHLPGNGSLKLLQVIREKKYPVMVIILSIHISTYDMEQCKLLGADFFLDKFLEFEQIPGIINSMKILN